MHLNKTAEKGGGFEISSVLNGTANPSFDKVRLAGRQLQPFTGEDRTGARLVKKPADMQDQAYQGGDAFTDNHLGSDFTALS